MNPNLMEQFLGPSTQFFCFNQNEVNVVASPMDKKTCLMTKRNVFGSKGGKFKNPDIISSSYINNKSTAIMRSSYTKFFHDDEPLQSCSSSTSSDKTIDLIDDADTDGTIQILASLQTKKKRIK